MAATAEQLVALARQYQVQQIRLTTIAVNTIARAWDTILPIGDTEAATFVGQVLPVVEGTQATAATLGATYIDTYATLAGDPVLPPLDEALDVATLRGGTPAETVYLRPVVTVRRALSEGRARDVALGIGRARLLQTVDTDIALAARRGSDRAMRRRSNIVGYRRVPDATACKFCLLASTQRYHRGDLMPLHPHCHCIVAPIIGSVDPGQVLDKPLLDRLKADGVVDQISAARSVARSQLRVRTHGELGPVLIGEGQTFTGPDLVAA